MPRRQSWGAAALGRSRPGALSWQAALCLAVHVSGVGALDFSGTSYFPAQGQPALLRLVGRSLAAQPRPCCRRGACLALDAHLSTLEGG